MKFVDRTGLRHGSLIPVKFERRGLRIWWFCKCDCGNSLWVIGTNLSLTDERKTRSCGCSKDGNPTHGWSGTPEHKAWKALRQRCNNPNDTVFHHYGGRGIKVCKRWNKFENFLADMGKRPGPKYSVERKKVNGNYTPSNCVWATVKVQRRNRRDSVRITYKGQTKQISDWADFFGIDQHTLRARYYRKVPIERLFTIGRLLRQSKSC